MLYGNLIFIKKTGGDGSKFPVTEKNLKIGRSEACLIRIHNPQVAAEHCELNIRDDGQAILRNFSPQTILNGKDLNLGDVALWHGDIFKLGERLVRWEYVPASKYYKQIVSPSGCLAAVVMPQQRTVNNQETSVNSTSQVSVMKSTPLGKRKSEKGIAESSSAAKLRKGCGQDVVTKSKNDLSKLLVGCHSHKATKLLLSGTKVKNRKSISGVVRTPKIKLGGKSRKSTLPSWKVNVITPPNQESAASRNFQKNSQRKKSLKRAVNTPLNPQKHSKKLLLIPESAKNSPQKVSGVSVLLENDPESQQNKGEETIKSTRSLSKSSSPKKSSPKLLSKIVSSTPKQKFSNLTRLVNSESKLNLGKYSGCGKSTRGMSLILENVNSTAEQGSIKKLHESFSEKQGKNKVSEEIVSDTTAVPSKTILFKKDFPSMENQNIESLSTPLKKRNGKTLVKSSLKKETKPLEDHLGTPRSVAPKLSESPTENQSLIRRSASKQAFDLRVKTPLLIGFNTTPSPKQNGPRQSSKSTPARKPTAKKVNNTRKTLFSKVSCHQNLMLTSSPASSAVNFTTLTSTSQKSSMKKTPSKKIALPSRTSASSPRGVRRKLSPSSSAERAAKMLKTSSPKKPDKNKKKALLVLGIANRKQLLSQNTKVLLKQKILKKAIKQSTAFDSLKDETKKKSGSKTKVMRMKFVKLNEKSAKKRVLVRKSPPKVLKTPSVSSKEFLIKTQEETPKGKVQLETSLSIKKVQTPLRKSPSKEKKTESSFPIISNRISFNETTSPSGFDKTTENYFLNSSRRCSKRLSSKNDTGRPDFVELSPTALGLIPKNMEIFKTAKESKRRSSSMVTPRSNQTIGIIKSASSSKIGNRKSVRFSSKDASCHSDLLSPSDSDKVLFDCSSFHTPDITVDVFVSPLKDKDSVKKNELNELKTPKEGILPIKIRISSSEHKCVRKLLQSPQANTSLDKVSPQKSVSKNRVCAIESQSAIEQAKPDEKKNFKKDLDNIEGVQQLLSIPKAQKNQKIPKNDLSDVKGVKELFQTPKQQKSPKNELTDLRGVKKLLRTPTQQKSPKNDLMNVEGVKKLLRTPRQQKSPRNDLTDVRGVKKLLRTPRQQKSPKNDLTDVRGVKKLLQTPKQQKSPKNDLTDVRGVKKLLRTPRQQKSPKNDLTDVRGVKKLLQTPKKQKSPKNDLTDVRGVKKLLQTPKQQKSPKNDLTDVRGVKKLLRTPRQQKSPKNDLSDVKGIKKLMRTPRAQKSPKNDLTDLIGVKALLGSPKVQKCPANDLSDLTGVKKMLTTPQAKRISLGMSGMRNLFKSPLVQNISTENTKAVSHSPLLEVNLAGVKQLLISKSPECTVKNKTAVSRKSVKDFRAIRGRRAIHTSSKEPKNDLSDLTGIPELFARHESPNDYNVSLDGVAELFDLSNVEGSLRDRRSRKSTIKSNLQTSRKNKKTTENLQKVEKTKTITRGSRLRKAAAERISVTKLESKKTRNKEKVQNAVEEKKPAKRRAVEKVRTGQGKKSSALLITKKNKTSTKKSQVKEKEASINVKARTTRKRKASAEVSDMSPPKLGRKLPAAQKEVSKIKAETSRRAASSTKKKAVIEKKVSSRRKGSDKEEKTAKTSPKVQSKKTSKSVTKQIQKLQSRSQRSSNLNYSNSEVKVSPRKTRSAKRVSDGSISKKASTSKAQSKAVRSATARKKSSPLVKRSTRRK